ncbi:hypothetical protein EVAR_79487_1 [Eumeta japonica]|uniref:Uncharacterized protein n=1 Tax=Eumeta variegata TaxID=151549 RepID=A0A4C1UDX9_EUMVA|nr:hypothetical protein EVAR_79487_1 [Eumeta japonica]
MPRIELESECLSRKSGITVHLHGGPGALFCIISEFAQRQPADVEHYKVAGTPCPSSARDASEFALIMRMRIYNFIIDAGRGSPARGVVESCSSTGNWDDLLMSLTAAAHAGAPFWILVYLLRNYGDCFETVMRVRLVSYFMRPALMPRCATARPGSTTVLGATRHC